MPDIAVVTTGNTFASLILDLWGYKIKLFSQGKEKKVTV